MSVKPGDRVQIIKAGHPAFGRAGVVLGGGHDVVYVACADPHAGKAWPVFVLYLHHLALIARGDPAIIEDIIDACEARGCPLRGIYPWAGPYYPKTNITG